MKKFLIIISILIILVIITFFVYLHFFFSPFSCKNIVENSLDNPSKNYAVNIITKDCGAREYSQSFYIYNLNKRDHNNYGTLFASHSLPNRVNIKWGDDSTIRMDCLDEGLYFFKENIDEFIIIYSNKCFNEGELPHPPAESP